MTRKKIYSLGGLVAAALLFALVNLAGGPLLRGARLDLTENHLHTLSPGTIHILKNLPEPVTLQLYLSRAEADRHPSLKTFADRVGDVLAEYAAESGGRLTLERIDPEPFSAGEDDAVRYGLQGVPVGDGESLYFGLVATTAKGSPQVIPLFQQNRERFLEYDLTQMVQAVAHPQKPVVGLLSALPINGGFSAQSYQMQPPWMIVEQLRRQFDLRTLPADTREIPAGTDVLMVVQPQMLPETALYAIDQFVLAGGRAVVFTDPLAETLGSEAANPVQETPAADKLLAAWGVRLEPGVIGDLELAQKVTAGGPLRPQVVDYLPWLAVGPEQMDRDDVVTGQLGQLNLASAGSLVQLPEARTEMVPLLRSSDRAMLLKREQVAFSPDPGRLLADFKPSGKPYILAARISGPAATAFPAGPPAAAGEKPDGKKKEEKKAKEKVAQPQLKESKKPLNLIVVADTDLLDDRFWVQVQDLFGQRLATPIAANADFALNALDQLGGSPDLISVRSRGSFERPFTLVNEIRQKAEGQYQAREQELVARLKETQGKLNQLQQKRRDAGSSALTPEQEKEVDKFRSEIVGTRKDLREVQYNLRRDILGLEATLKVFNIFFVPSLIVLAAFLAWLFRRHRSRGYTA